MAKVNIIELNVPQLFVTHSISEIIEIEKSVDAEIERKRIELRSIVGDRYKDILTATEAIKSIESISESIVVDIESVLGKCDILVENTNAVMPSKLPPIDKETLEERTILMQIRLAIELNENIWVSIDSEDYCHAAQFYLLAQHVHTGLRLLKPDMIEKYRIIAKLKVVVDLLRQKILQGCLNKLKNVELSIEDTCSLLNAIMLLENHASTNLLNKFINIRKNALESVIKESFSSVRMQISAMVKCIYTTMQLLHDCFFNYKDTREGLMWKELNAIVHKDAATTLSKVQLSQSQCKMHAYIPQIIKEFRPKCVNVTSNLPRKAATDLIQQLLLDITASVRNGLSQHLELVPNIKGLHLIREEALKIEMPNKWEDICIEIELPRNFDVWYYFFQDVVTQRVQYLITQKTTICTRTLCNEIAKVLRESPATSNASNSNSENDLRWYIWHENSLSDDHKTLSMKTKGFSPSIVRLCAEFDDNYHALLKDLALYLYGREYTKDEDLYGRVPSQSHGNNKKFVDRETLESHLKFECSNSINVLINNLEQEVQTGNSLVTKSIVCARFLTALSALCPSFNKCCCCNHSSDEWDKICNVLNSSTLKFWDNWINDCNAKLIVMLKQSFDVNDSRKMLSTLCKWDSIEIQEQTDENVFKSQIKIPMKSSMALAIVLDRLTEMLNALFPHTLPKQVHLKFMETNILSLLAQYEAILLVQELNQMQALQFLFDVKYMTTLTVPRENMALVQRSQDVCDKFRSLVDPFDLDVFYKYLQHNVRQSALQSQVIYGCLLPSSNQLASLGVLEKNKEHEKDPSILALSTPSNNNWFMLLPVTAPSTKTSHPVIDTKVSGANAKEKPKKNQENSVRAGAAALFGAMANDWFS